MPQFNQLPIMILSLYKTRYRGLVEVYLSIFGLHVVLLHVGPKDTSPTEAIEFLSPPFYNIRHKLEVIA